MIQYLTTRLPTRGRVETLLMLTIVGGFGGTICETLLSGHPWTGLLWGTICGVGFAMAIPAYILERPQ